MRFKFKNFKINQSALIKATTSQLRKSPQAKRKAKDILDRDWETNIIL